MTFRSPWTVNPLLIRDLSAIVGRSRRDYAKSALVMLVLTLLGPEEGPILLVDQRGEGLVRRARRVRPEGEVHARHGGGPAQGGMREDALEVEAVGSGVRGTGGAGIPGPPKHEGDHGGLGRIRVGEERVGQRPIIAYR